MAKVNVKMPEEFLLKVSRLGEKTDDIIPKVLEAGGKVVEASSGKGRVVIRDLWSTTNYPIFMYSRPY